MGKIVKLKRNGRIRTFLTMAEACKKLGMTYKSFQSIVSGRTDNMTGYTIIVDGMEVPSMGTGITKEEERTVFGGRFVFMPYTGEHRCNRCIFAEDERCYQAQCDGGYYRMANCKTNSLTIKIIEE